MVRLHSLHKLNNNLNGGAMPTYLFECECGKVTEKVLSLDQERTHTCDCGKEAKRIYTVIPAHFKGTGWGSKP